MRTSEKTIQSELQKIAKTYYLTHESIPRIYKIEKKSADGMTHRIASFKTLKEAEAFVTGMRVALSPYIQYEK